MTLIEKVEPVKFSFFDKPPASTMTHALVYINQNNEYLTVKNGDRLTKSEIRTKKFHKMCTVNVQQHTFFYKDEVLTATRGRKFLVQLYVDYYVEKPELLVQQNAGEISVIFNKYLPFWVESEAANYDIHADKHFRSQIEDLFLTSSLVSVLKEAGVTVRDIRVMIKPSLIDQEQDGNLVDIDRKAELAKKISATVRAAMAEGDFIVAYDIAKENEMARKMVDSQVREDEMIRHEVITQVKTLMNTSVDAFEAREQLSKLKMLLPSLNVDLDILESLSKDSDGQEELDDMFEAYISKGEQI
ncbi:hypothetical protein LCL96_18080 [Rossellomorea aquimaris]|uniref:hypothetical protein n=1 Tax=Rossellomorea aquimaris TaxID=189382 RepID=UPI001CD59AFC|nr:hypothetical protein [Rossellomorea aquimaris]MCA1060826.1 hypothetical protein [Rossellomorea aquimaris]